MKILTKTLILMFILCYSGVFSRIDSTIFSEDSIRYYLDNDAIRVGFDKRMGGAVSYFVRKSNGQNLINNHDAGRQAGFETRIYPDAPTTWKPYPAAQYLSDVYPGHGGATREWNGLPQGSFFNQYLTNVENNGGMPENVLFDAKTGVLYIKAKLWEWGFVKPENGVYKKIDAGAYNEYWVSLNGIAADFSVKQVRNIPYFVSNTNIGLSLNIYVCINYPFTTKWQTYNATEPFTNKSVQTKTSFDYNSNNNFWTNATENWVAMTNQNDFGMGIYTKASDLTFLYAEKQSGNFCPPPSLTCTDENKYAHGNFSFSSYSFPCGEPCVTPNSSTTLNFSFLAGNITEIRQFAYQKHTNPCHDIIALSSKNNDFGINSTKKAKLLIDANNSVFNASTIYQSGKSIVLKPNFEVSSGAVFETKISSTPCN